MKKNDVSEDSIYISWARFTEARFGLLELKYSLYFFGIEHSILMIFCVLLEVIRRLILPQKSHNLKWLNLTFYPLDSLLLLWWVVLISLWSFCCFILNTDLENYAEFLLSLWCLQPSRVVFSCICFFFLFNPYVSSPDHTLCTLAAFSLLLYHLEWKLKDHVIRLQVSRLTKALQIITFPILKCSHHHSHQLAHWLAVWWKIQ